MARPFQCFSLCCAVCVAWGYALAEDTPPAATSGRVISPRTAELLASALPKYAPPTDASASPAPPPILLRAGPPEPETDVVRLPRYVVRDTKVPPATRVDPGPYRQHLMEQYLGAEDALDRGFLNAFTIADLWNKIPLLRRASFASSISNANRAALLYGQDERIRKKQDLSDLISVSKQPKDAPENVKLTRELRDAFMRKN